MSPRGPPPRAKLGHSSGGAVSADHARHRQRARRAAVSAAPLTRERGGRVSRASSPVPVARAFTAWTCGLRERASRRPISARTRAPPRSRRAMISPTRAAITWPARDAPPCHAPPRDATTRYPTISPKSPTGSNSEPQPGHRSPIGSASLSVLCRRVLHSTHFKWGIGMPPIRTTARSGDRSDAPWCGRDQLAGRSDGVGRRSPRRLAATRDHDRVRLDRAPLSPVASGSWASGLPSLCRLRAQGRGQELTRVQSDWGRSHRAGGITPVEAHHRPRSQNQSPAPPAS